MDNLKCKPDIYCKTCIYGDYKGSCNYMLRTNKKRNCAGGKDCTKRVEGESIKTDYDDDEPLVYGKDFKKAMYSTKNWDQ